ncbi:MAG: hypothetical protein QOE83_17 [Actinomycetota bacterium]|nr:hypothetical protein [Actinomycetota bacterium]
MVTIRLGNQTRPLEEVDASWITRHVGGRQHEGVPVCVEVRIWTDILDMWLATPACCGGVTGGGPPRPEEVAIFHLWEKLGLGSDEFSGGQRCRLHCATPRLFVASFGWTRWRGPLLLL